VTITQGQLTITAGTYTTSSFPFYDDFSADKGWSGYEEDGWKRGPAYAGRSEAGNPDPATDYTATADNYVLGYVIGGNYPHDLLVEKEIISRPSTARSEPCLFEILRYLNVGSNASDYARIYVSNDRTNWLLVWENPRAAQWMANGHQSVLTSRGLPRVRDQFT